MQIGSYIVERAVEQKNALTVYATRHQSTGKAFLLTVFTPNSLEDANRWTSRLNAIQRLKHPNIVTPAEDNRTVDGVPFAVSPLVTPLLGRDRVLSPLAVLDVAKQISAALDYAHQQGIVHGLLGRIHIAQTSKGRASRFAIRGFELAGGDSQSYTPADDIAALGAYVHRALTGQPITDNTVSRLLPHVLATVIQQAVTNSRGYESAGAFYNALAQAVKTLPATVRRNPLVRSSDSPSLKRPANPLRFLLVFLISLIVLGALATGLYLLITQNTANNPALPTQAAMLPTDTPTKEIAPILAPTLASMAITTPTESTEIAAGTSAPTIGASATEAIIATTPAASPTRPGVITATPFTVLTDTPGPTPTDTETAVPTATITPIITEPPADTATAVPVVVANAPKPCLSLVGDSVTHGGVTYDIPDTGYIVGLTRPLADVVNEQLRKQGLNDLIAYDRGASNTGINSTNHPSYFNSSSYADLQADHCKFTIIMPWYNDITPDRIPQADAAPQHVRAIITLAHGLADANPMGRIIVLNYYEGAVAAFASETWASGFTPENRDLYNKEIKLSCDIGSLSKISQVTCLNTDDAFQGMGDSYVIGPISHDDLTKNLISPLNEVQQGWLDAYFAINPDGLLTGDGIHLSLAGKVALGNYFVQIVRSLPDLPPPTAAR
ncbi:MAG: hypothetical protein ABI947_06320 [Chloroflexota bacterium]